MHGNRLVLEQVHQFINYADHNFSLKKLVFILFKTQFIWERLFKNKTNKKVAFCLKVS